MRFGFYLIFGNLLISYACWKDRAGVGVGGKLCLIVSSLRPSRLLTLVANRVVLLLQGKSDTLRTGEGVLEPREVGVGEALSCGIGVRVTFTSRATCRLGACLLGWELGVQKPSSGTN